MDNDTTRRQCAATTPTGDRCGMAPMHDSSFCNTHDPRPGVREAREAARREGGRQRGCQLRRAGGAAARAPGERPPWWRLETVSDARASLAYVAQELLDGRMAARDANAATLTVKTIVEVLREEDVARRLEAVETALRLPRRMP